MIIRFLVMLATLAATVGAQVADTGRARSTPPSCADCVVWNAPQPPFRVYGNTYYVGPHGLGAILITSDSGHVLVDAALPESVPSIVANIRALGFRVEDIRLIVNSHVHFDHAGGIAELQRLSGAVVAASPWSAAVLRRGSSGPDDPQYGVLRPIAPVPTVRIVADGEAVRVGPIAVTAHFTAGHTPGGTSWSWQSCENGPCLDLVYADSQTPVSADGFSFARSKTYSSAIRDFERGFTALESMSCDILLTPHPDASGLWARVAQGTLVNPRGCKEYAAAARKRLAQRLATEAQTP